MIDFIKSWVEQISLTVIIASIFEIILPNGNLKKYIKIVLGIYVIFSIISPFVDSKALYNIKDAKVDKLIENIANLNEINSGEINSSKNSMDTRLEELYLEELEADIKKKVKEYGYDIYKCDIEANFKNSSNSPGIHKIDLTIKQGTSNINKIEDVNISISTIKETQDEIKSNDTNIENIRNNLAEYYGIELDQITINGR